MPIILPQIKHIVVVMFENRSLDNICGWLYRDPAAPPKCFLPACYSAFASEVSQKALFLPFP
jgi:hypothetical protein